MQNNPEEQLLPPVLDYLVKQKTNIGLALLAIFAISFLFFRSSGEKPFFEAEKALVQYKEKGDSKYLDRLITLTEKHKKLKAKYQGLVIDRYYGQSNLSALKSEVNNSSYYLSQIFPLYDEYSKCSLLISQGKKKEALIAAKSLEKKLIDAKEQNSLLYQYNQIRIALLHNNLGDAEKELLVYENLKKSENTIPLSEKEITFSDFIEHRAEKLRN